MEKVLNNNRAITRKVIQEAVRRDEINNRLNFAATSSADTLYRNLRI